FHLPIRDSSVDILLNCFSPLAEEEFRRVLKKGGYFIYVVPAAGHLWEMKSIAYDKPYQNEEKDIEYEGFKYADIIEVKSKLSLENQTDISNLFSMTPYFWRTPREGVQRLSQLEKLETAAEFRIHILKKL
ncbi:MAG: 50S rRNA methyltransferase, partial [Oscillospiraceae bacterium]|nr:50S rRNA methyltransferase [Oscillospiraceae bacterium]